MTRKGREVTLEFRDEKEAEQFRVMWDALACISSNTMFEFYCMLTQTLDGIAKRRESSDCPGSA